jgi:hypothetical protein
LTDINIDVNKNIMTNILCLSNNEVCSRVTKLAMSNYYFPLTFSDKLGNKVIIDKDEYKKFSDDNIFLIK